MKLEHRSAERRDVLPMLTRELPISSFNEETRTVDITWTTGAAVRRRRYDWARDRVVEYDEILVVSSEAINMERLAAGAPMLDSHSTWSTRAVVGVVERAWLEGEGDKMVGAATVRFPKAGLSEDADRIAALVSDRIIRNNSVGYTADKVRIVPATDTEVEKWFVERWTPYEISFVTINADASAQVRGIDSADGAALFPFEVINRAEPTVKEVPVTTATEAKPAGQTAPETRSQETTQAPPVVANTAAADIDKAVRAAIDKHTKDSGEIRTIVRTAGLDDKFADDLIARGVAPEYAGNHVLEEMVKRHGKGAPAFSRARQVGDSGEDPAVISQRMSDALAAKMSPRITMTDEARAFAPMSMLEMGVHLMEARGERLPTMRTAQERYDQLQRVMSTSDFPQILANSSNRVLLAEHAAAAPTFKKVFAKKTFKDFRPHSFIRSGDFPILLEKGETADYKNGAIGESKNQLVLGEYGRIVSISRRVLINDDLGAFAALPRQAAKRSAQFENQMAWALLALNAGAGPTVYDPEINSGNGRPLFHANHGNLAGSGAAISVDTVGAGRAAMMVQKGVGKDAGIANIQPSYALTGALALTAAEQFFVLITAPTTDGTTNPFKGKIEPIGDGNLSGNAWYLFADPDEAETLVYGYLEGAEGPRFETRSRFENEGIDFKIAEDFAVGAVDFRGAYKNPGA